MTYFAELRIAWSTDRTPTATVENERGGKLKKLSAGSG
jgi:hypothetical protein